jgi:hypothetical protein
MTSTSISASVSPIKATTSTPAAIMAGVTSISSMAIPFSRPKGRAVTVPPRETWPDLRNTLDAKCMLAGICGTCKPARHVVVSVGPLIERFGADAKIRDVADRITCNGCGAKLHLSVVPIDTDPAP